MTIEAFLSQWQGWCIQADSSLPIEMRQSKYAVQAGVDSAQQGILAADVISSGSEQAMLLLMIDHNALVRRANTLITVGAGNHSDANIAALEHARPPS